MDAAKGGVRGAGVGVIGVSLPCGGGLGRLGLLGSVPETLLSRSRSNSGAGSWLVSLSPGAWLIVGLGLVTFVLVMLRPSSRPEGDLFWTFSREHADLYEAILLDWNETADPPVTMQVMDGAAIKQRMLGGFLANLPTADLLEIERRMASGAFAGPLEAVGFVDLTDRLAEEGLLERITPAALSPWSTRGRVFGLPHDVHPVLLSYRSDIVEEAGVDVGEIETWDDFERVLWPLMDTDGDGVSDRYLISFWASPSQRDGLELLINQADGFFDASDRLRVNTPLNARVLAKLVTWTSGPFRIAADVPEFSGGGDAQRAAGYVLFSFTPDWMCYIRRKTLPQLTGKMKVMPMPAWEPGGRRTSVWGGTMLGIPKTTRDFERAWGFAKHLYLSDELARALYTNNDIITPVMSHWDDPIFDEPDPYFSGQAKGRMYIDQAPDVPRRSGSAYAETALDRTRSALESLVSWAGANGVFDGVTSRRDAEDRMLGRATELLEEVEAQVRVEMRRSLFLLAEEEADGE